MPPLYHKINESMQRKVIRGGKEASLFFVYREAAEVPFDAFESTELVAGQPSEISALLMASVRAFLDPADPAEPPMLLDITNGAGGLSA